jgi:hypothetical protein
MELGSRIINQNCTTYLYLQDKMRYYSNMQNTRNISEGLINKGIEYRKIRLAGGATSASMALTLPKRFLDSLRIKSGDHVVISLDVDKMIIQIA